MKKTLALVCALLAGALSAPASAHGLHGIGEGFAAGFAHAFLGLDHLVAMIAVGMCAVRMRSRAWRVACGAMAALLYAGFHAALQPAEYSAFAYLAGLFLASTILELVGAAIALVQAKHSSGQQRMVMRGRL